MLNNIIPSFYSLYCATAWFARPLVDMYIQKRVTKGKEIEDRLPERFGQSAQLRPAGTLIWFHVASLGEGLSALSLINRFVKQGSKVLVTYGTKTAATILPGRFPPAVQHCFVPIDLPIYVGRFLDHWQPDLGVFIESELWPCLLMESKARNIPLVLMNGRMSERSFDRWFMVRPIAQNLLSAFTLGLVQDDAMATRYRKLGMSPVKILGNLKMASDPLPYHEDVLTSFFHKLEDRPHWLAASLHLYEAEFVIDAHLELIQKFPNLLTLIAPRKLEQRDELLAKLSAANIPYITHNLGGDISKAQVFVIDTMGEMGTFFRLSRICYVGGSQPKTSGKPLGGHNPLEPALLNNAICFGPDMSNARAAADGLLSARGAMIVSTSKALSDFVAKLLADPDMRDKKAMRAMDFANSKASMLDDAMDELQTVLDERHPTIVQKTPSSYMATRPDFWASHNMFSKALWVPSLAYATVSKMYQSQKEKQRLGVPVICVGNLVVGGAGKTPTVVALAQMLVQQGHQPHIISRGYGRKRTDTLRVTPERSPADVGDEALILCQTCPTWVTSNRHHAGQKAIQAGATHIILDDGFQDQSLHKDVSLLVFDGLYGIGNGNVLPAGPLRESLEDGMSRAAATIIVGEDKKAITDALWDLPNIKAKLVPTSTLPAKPMVAFAGIGNPDKFFETIQEMGAEVLETRSLPDHVPYTPELIAELIAAARKHGADLVTTEKDAVKLPKDLPVPVHVVKVQLQFEKPEQILSIIGSADAHA